MNTSAAVDGFLLARTAEGYSPHTIRDYRLTLRRLVEHLEDPDIATITATDVRSFMAAMRARRYRGKPLGQHTLANMWCAIRSFFGWCLEERLITSRPDAGLKRPQYTRQPIEPFSREDIAALLKAAEYTAEAVTHGRRPFRMRRPTARRDAAIVLFLLDTGLRVGEVERLTVADVDLESGEVAVHPYNSGRKSRGRHVYLGNVARRALWRYLAEREPEPTADDPLFVSLDRYPMDRSSISHMLRELGKRAGVAKVHPHRFRHTMALWFLRNGGDVFSLQRILGHSTLDMVRQYVALAEADAASAHRRASPADNWRLNG